MVLLLSLALSLQAQQNLRELVVQITASFDEDNNQAGTGFIWVSNGVNFIVTNRHVIERDGKVSNYFKVATALADGRIIIFPYSLFGDIWYDRTKPELDLAIIPFLNEERPFTRGLPIGGNVSDGTAIWAAGYPSSSWRLTNGVVSNSRFIIENQRYIEHTAEIAGGNFGGPLLTQDSNGNFTIVGVNTRRDDPAVKIPNNNNNPAITGRVAGNINQNFAIPASTLTQFLATFQREWERSYRDPELSDKIYRVQIVPTQNPASQALTEVIPLSQNLSTQPNASLTTLFPDTNLRNAVAQSLGRNSNLTGQALINALAEIRELRAANKNISNAGGIEHLTGLIVLVLNSNRLTTIDVSRLTQLSELYLWDNQLTSLNVNNNTNLALLSLSSNRLTNLDISNNTLLNWLGIANMPGLHLNETRLPNTVIR